MKISELFEGWFDKKPKEKKLHRTDITAEDRAMITSVFRSGHNANMMKNGDEYVLPQNVTLNYKKARVNFYKNGDQLIADVGWYSDEDGPGNPRRSPMAHFEENISNVASLKKLKAMFDGDKIDEEIKGWKHAGRDLAKHRAEKGKDVKLVRLKKDGTESGMNDATKLFRSEEEARRHHESMTKLNPGKSIKHNMYIDGKAELLEGKRPTKSYGRGAYKYWIEAYDEKTGWGDVIEVKANSEDEVYDFCSKQGWEVQGLEKLDEAFREGVAPPFQTFKKGQIVTVKKTGEKVEVLSQNDIGLVHTVSTNPDKRIKNWRDYSASTLKGGLIGSHGHQEYMPRELQEGWKMGVAAAALSGALVAGIANSPSVKIEGQTAHKALGPTGPNAKTAEVEINGVKKKVKYWRSIMKNQRGMLVYKVEE